MGKEQCQHFAVGFLKILSNIPTILGFWPTSLFFEDFSRSGSLDISQRRTFRVAEAESFTR